MINQLKFKSIESQRIRLRKFKESDAEVFFKYRTNPKVALYQGEGWDNYKFEQAACFVKEQSYSEPGIPDTWFQLVIELKETGEVIGDCAIHTLSQEKNQVEIGFTLDPLFQNKGYGYEAVKSLLWYIFEVMKMHRVIVLPDVRNESSIKLLEKLQMRREGHFVKNAWYRGEYVDEFLYAILEEE